MNNLITGDRARATLEQLLARREERAAEQRALLARGSCVVSFTLNIAGAQKSFPLADLCFEEGTKCILEALAPLVPEERLDRGGATGRECLLALRSEAVGVKRRMLALERTHPLGRLWDIDVLGADGKSISRTQLGEQTRRCIVCGGDAKGCARSRAHGIEMVFEAEYRALDNYFREKTVETIARCAEEALVQEVSATPKPGLVDRCNCGAHRDMNYMTFLASIRALVPWLHTFAEIGWRGAAESDAEVFAELRAAGQQAEQAMLCATGGVNTHKGFIFSGALFCATAARLTARTGEVLRCTQLSNACAGLARYALADFEKVEMETTGLRLYHTHCLAGVRGEAAAGFPAVFEVGFPALRQWLARGICENDAALAALLHLIAAVADTNLIHRGGINAAEACKQEAALLLTKLTPETLVAQLTALDRHYIEKNLSPGGCADLLGLSLFLNGLVREGLLCCDA